MCCILHSLDEATLSYQQILCVKLCVHVNIAGSMHQLVFFLFYGISRAHMNMLLTSTGRVFVELSNSSGTICGENVENENEHKLAEVDNQESEGVIENTSAVYSFDFQAFTDIDSTFQQVLKLRRNVVDSGMMSNSMNYYQNHTLSSVNTLIGGRDGLKGRPHILHTKWNIQYVLPRTLSQQSANVCKSIVDSRMSVSTLSYIQMTRFLNQWWHVRCPLYQHPPILTTS